MSQAWSRGGIVVIVGPDGAGKSTLAEVLTDDLPGRTTRLHHRPHVLPGRTPTDVEVTEPHAQPTYGGLISALKALYLYLDHLLGWVSVIGPTRRRGDWVVLERGWWDIIVDPRRYRMRPTITAKALGYLLPRPDLTVILEADADALLLRKQEVARDELERQRDAWRTLDPPGDKLFLDATRPVDELRDTVLARLLGPEGATERPVGSAKSPGHVALPRPGDPRILIPRSPRRAAHHGLLVEQPSARSKRAAWRLLRGLALVGGFQLLPGASDPPREEHARLAEYVPPDGQIALARSQRAGSGYVALILDARGRPTGLAKCAVDDQGARSLAAEATAVQDLAPHLGPPVTAPRLLDVGEDLLLWEAILWRPQPRPWRPPRSVLRSLGRMFAVTGGGTHGDFTPWNLLRTEGGWVLIDWADGGVGPPPFYDVLHYLTQSHSALGRPSARSLLRGIGLGEGWVGDAVREYAASAGLRPETVPREFPRYLEHSDRILDPTDPAYPSAVRARRRLRDAVSTMPDRWPSPGPGVR